MSAVTTDPLDLKVDYPLFARVGPAGVRIVNICQREGWATLRDVVARTERDFLRCPNAGKRTLQALEATLADLGLNLTPNDDRHRVPPLPFPSMHERLARIEQRLDRLERMAGRPMEPL